MDEAEPFDWTPEVDLIKGLILPARVQVIPDYLDAARERASARSQMFIGAVIEDSGLAGEGLAALLRDDPQFAALFEAALGASARSAHEQRSGFLPGLLPRRPTTPRASTMPNLLRQPSVSLSRPTFVLWPSSLITRSTIPMPLALRPSSRAWRASGHARLGRRAGHREFSGL